MNCARICIAATVLAFCHPLALRAQQPGQESDFRRFLFAPELVMQHQGALGLTPQQRTAVTDAIRSLQGDVLEAQWQIREASQRLTELLRPPQVDAGAALAQVDRITALENTVKRLHMAMLIRIKNTLTLPQQRALAERRDGALPGENSR